MHTKNNMLIFVIIGFLCFFLLAGTGNARVITVGHTPGADYWNIQDAIDAANDGDEIQVWYGTYNENLIIDWPPSAEPLRIKSRDGVANTFIDGMGTGVIVDISSGNVELEGFTIQNGEIGIRVTGNNSKTVDNSIRNMTGVGGGNACGVYLHSADDNNVSRNNISNITGGKGTDVAVIGYAGKGGLSYGIGIDSGTNNCISSNTISSITGGTGGRNTGGDIYGHYGYGGYAGNSYGICLNSATNTQICYNVISGVSGGSGGEAPGIWGPYCYGYGGHGGYGYGICIDDSEDNELFRNSVSGACKGAGGYGTCAYGSAGIGYGIAAISDTSANILYHNNVENSDTQDGYDSGGNNAWDAGPGIGGNYWSDYQGTDDDGDGIGDTVYELAGGIGAKDFFPLIEPLSCEGDFDGDQDVDGSDLATFAAGGTTITLEEFATEFGRTDCPLYSDQLIAHR